MALLNNTLKFDPDCGVLPGFLFGVTRNLLLKHHEARRRYVPHGHPRDSDERLDGLRVATEVLGAPAQLEATLLSAFNAHRTKQHTNKRRNEIIAQWFAPGFALAASIGMSAWMVLVPMAGPMLDPDAQSASVAAAARTFADSPFIALQSLEQIALEPQPRLIETAVPRMWLASYGVPVSPETADDSLRAEMLVSANGQPLAMRFLP